MAIAALPVAFAACAGAAIPTPIDGEPVCKDFEVGAAHTKMSGSLRYPVLLQIKMGKTLVFKTTLTGRRSEADQPTRVLLADDNETFTVEWAQCENERAAKAVESIGRDAKGVAKYECGKAEVYKTDTLVTKKGDRLSHALTFQAPPNPACWQSAEMHEHEIADAGAPDASAESNDGGPPGDAGAMAEAPDAGAAGDAGATSASDAGAAGDAGVAGDAGKPDAGAAKSK